MQKIQINNNNLGVTSALIMDDLAQGLEQNQSSNFFTSEKKTTAIPNTKGEVLNYILITLGTTITPELIVFLVKEIVKKYIDKKTPLKISVEKNNTEINISTEGNTKDLDISIKLD